MIKSALVAMTILGCNCEQNTCEYVRTAGIPSTSIAECQSRMKAEIERTDAEYPLLVAVCENLPDAAGHAAGGDGRAADRRARRGHDDGRANAPVDPGADSRTLFGDHEHRQGWPRQRGRVRDDACRLGTAANLRGRGTALVSRASRSRSGACRCASVEGKNGRGPAGAASRPAIVTILCREIHGLDRPGEVGAVVERIDDRHRPGLFALGHDRGDIDAALAADE